jgi:hypothetical protein
MKILKIMNKNTAFFFFMCMITTPIIAAQTKYGIWLIPSFAEKINGIAIGPVESIYYDNSCNDTQQIINGVTIDLIGLGFLTPFALKDDMYNDIFQNREDSVFVKKFLISADSNLKKEQHRPINNGLTLATTGIVTGKVNGVLICGFANLTSIMNGLSICPFMNFSVVNNGVSIAAVNRSYRVNGVQIGLFNRAVVLKGFQIGLWNKNLKRSLPFINWGF